MDFSSGRFQVKLYPVAFVEVLMETVTSFRNFLFLLLLLRSQKILSFMISSEWIRGAGLGVSCGMGGFLYSLELMAISLGQSLLRRVLAICLSPVWALTLRVWFLSGMFRMSLTRNDFAQRLPANPNVWTECSLVLDKVSGASYAGSGVYARLHADAWSHCCWGGGREEGGTLMSLA